MKLLVVLALLGLVAGRKHRHHDYCASNSDAQQNAEAVRDVIELFLPNIIGHCESAKAAIEAGTFFTYDCEAAFDQAYCYVSNKAAEYNLEEALAQCSAGEGDYTVSATYTDMAKALAPGGDVHHLGRLACNHALPCFEHVVEQIAECAATTDNFYATALDNAVDLLAPIIEENAGAMEEFVACHFGAESDAMTLLGLVQDRITSFDDVVALFNEYFSEEDQATLANDAKQTLYDFIDGASDFCDAQCVSKTAHYFRGLFFATHDRHTCPAIGLYCGGCQNNADSFIASGRATVPCCTQQALESISSAIYDLIADYSDVASDIEADVKAAAEAAGISTEEYEAMKELGMEQAACLEDTYEKLANSDCA